MKGKRGKIRGSGEPKSQFFEVHGSKFKPDPIGNSGQTAVARITHGMCLFSISEYPLNGFLPHRLELFATLRFSQLFHQFQIFLPDMGGQQLLPLLICSAQRFAGAVLTILRRAPVAAFPVPACGCVPQDPALRTDDVVPF